MSSCDINKLNTFVASVNLHLRNLSEEANICNTLADILGNGGLEYIDPNNVLHANFLHSLKLISFKASSNQILLVIIETIQKLCINSTTKQTLLDSYDLLAIFSNFLSRDLSEETYFIILRLLLEISYKVVINPNDTDFLHFMKILLKVTKEKKENVKLTETCVGILCNLLSCNYRVVYTIMEITKIRDIYGIILELEGTEIIRKIQGCLLLLIVTRATASSLSTDIVKIFDHIYHAVEEGYVKRSTQLLKHALQLTDVIFKYKYDVSAYSRHNEKCKNLIVQIKGNEAHEEGFYLLRLFRHLVSKNAINEFLIKDMFNESLIFGFIGKCKNELLSLHLEILKRIPKQEKDVILEYSIQDLNLIKEILNGVEMKENVDIDDTYDTLTSIINLMYQFNEYEELHTRVRSIFKTILQKTMINDIPVCFYDYEAAMKFHTKAMCFISTCMECSQYWKDIYTELMNQVNITKILASGVWNGDEQLTKDAMNFIKAGRVDELANSLKMKKETIDEEMDKYEKRIESIELSLINCKFQLHNSFLKSYERSLSRNETIPVSNIMLVYKLKSELMTAKEKWLNDINDRIKKQVDEKSSEMEKIRKNIFNKHLQVEYVTKGNDAMSSTLKEEEIKIKNLKTALEQLELDVASREKTAETMEKRLEDIVKESKEKSSTIEKLKEQVEELNCLLSETEKMYKTKEEHLTERGKILEENEKTLSQKNAEIQKHVENIKNLENEERKKDGELANSKDILSQLQKMKDTILNLTKAGKA